MPNHDGKVIEWTNYKLKVRGSNLEYGYELDLEIYNKSEMSNSRLAGGQIFY